MQPPPAAKRSQPARAQKRVTPRKKVRAAAGSGTKQAVRRVAPGLRAAEVGSEDGLLLVGGLVLVVLVVADTVFLTLSRRALRPS